MGLKQSDEFRQDAGRIALTSGLARKQVADDPGVGMSTLNKWITAHLRQRPSSRGTKDQSCTNFKVGPLKRGC